MSSTEQALRNEHALVVSQLESAKAEIEVLRSAVSASDERDSRLAFAEQIAMELAVREAHPPHVVDETPTPWQQANYPFSDTVFAEPPTEAISYEFKDGVPQDTLRVEAEHAAQIAGEIHIGMTGRLAVITSTTEGKHSVKRSAHHRGDAWDMRSHYLKIPDMASDGRFVFLDRLREELGSDYVVILEAEGEPNEHFHVHWSPVYHAGSDPSAGTIEA